MHEEIAFVKKFILRKLLVLGKIGGAHTSVFNLSKGLPNHLRSAKKGQKAIKQAIKELINGRFLLSKQSTDEQHVSINPKTVQEIKKFLESE